VKHAIVGDEPTGDRRRHQRQSARHDPRAAPSASFNRQALSDPKTWTSNAWSAGWAALSTDAWWNCAAIPFERAKACRAGSRWRCGPAR
jgi:hypothetical protein